MTKKTRKVKGWGIVRLRDNEFGDKLFKTKTKGQDALREAAYHPSPEFMREAMAGYRVVKCEISYTINTSNRK